MINKMRDIAKGFTLIETLIAVLLLTTAVAGPLTIASKGLSAALVARDQMIAFYLAQDGVEYVRFIRDSNKLAGGAWLAGLDACVSADGCTVDPAAGIVQACPGSGCPTLRKASSGDDVYFSYLSGTETPQNFVRTVTLESPPTGETTEAVLTVNVSWRAQSGVTRSVEVQENLYDWQ